MKFLTAERWNIGKTYRNAATKQYDRWKTYQQDLLNENNIITSRLPVVENTSSLLKSNTVKLNKQCKMSPVKTWSIF